MPAIQLDKLKLQSANLAGKVGQPEEFLADLRELFDLYSNRTFRAGTDTLTTRLAASYHLPDRVIWQVERDLEPQIHIYDPEQSLILADTLWEGNSLEEKSLAIFILGQIPVDDEKKVVETITRWYQPGLDPVLQARLVTSGLTRLRNEKFIVWKKLIETWMDSDNIDQHAQAFLAQVELLQESGETHMPAISRLVLETALKTPTRLHPELVALFKAMVRVSEIESTFLMNEIIHRANARDLNQKRLLRKMIQAFPEGSQEKIKKHYLEHFRSPI
jgi:hypothetical protein